MYMIPYDPGNPPYAAMRDEPTEADLVAWFVRRGDLIEAAARLGVESPAYPARALPLTDAEEATINLQLSHRGLRLVTTDGWREVCRTWVCPDGHGVQVEGCECETCGQEVR
jgi:hypothetical protein